MKSVRCTSGIGLTLLCMFMLVSCQEQRPAVPDRADGAAQSGTISFARWMQEASLDRGEYDAVAFIMDGTCHGCQVTFNQMLTKASRRILVVSCDPATVSRYKQTGANVHYDSTCRMEYIDSLKTQTTVFFTSADSGQPAVVALDPGTVGKVVDRLR
jgi:hypothetical protein